ncbi:MAG: response regulator [Patescibacteria group bacterium]
MPEVMKVLIAEDDHFLSALLKARMDKEGFEVRQVFDGQEALDMLKEFHPTVIILDLIMPTLSGFEFLEQTSIDPQFNQIPVIILSNLGQDEDIQHAKQLGAKEYFVKARTSIDQVITVVKNLTQVKV